MTLRNGDSQRKSSVYNQTGQNYFEQLSSYNRMNSHLRRILMAQSVVDARNKKYLREKRGSSRSSSGSKSLDQILSRREFIDGVAYDTEHHPVDLLRMRLGCDPNCLHMARKQSLDQSYRSCSNIRCRGGSPRTSQRPEVPSGRYSRTSDSVSPVRCPSRSYGASRSSLLSGRRIDRQPEVDDSRQQLSEAPRTEKNNRRGRGFEAINETYSYDSSFESSSDTSGIDSPVAKNCGCAPPRTNFHSNPERTGSKEADIEFNQLPANVDRSEEAKYAKFLYNVTQEIVLKGLYTDRELHEVFKKHVEMNCGCLDKERMSREINQLKMSLNVKEFSENNENTKRLGVSCRRSSPSQAAKNAILLMDSGPDVLVTERELLVTLMEMKLDPQQVRTICRSLRNKMKETNGLEFREGTGQAPDEETQRKTENCECQCREKNATSGLSAEEKQAVNLSKKAEESQTDEKRPEVVSQASQVEGQSKEVTTSTSAGEMRKETRDISSSNSELQKLAEVAEQPKRTDEIVAENKTPDFSHEDERKSGKTSPQSEEDEKTETGRKNRSKKKKASSTGKKSSEQNDRIEKKDSQPAVESIQKSDKKIVQGPKPTGKKSVDGKKSSSPSRARKSTKAENVDLDKSRRKKESPKVGEARNISDDEATTTEIATEKDSHDPQAEKIDEPTDDELASLPEEISQAMDGSLSTINSEDSDKSEPKAEADKPITIEPESSGEKRNVHEAGESEGEEKSKRSKFDRKISKKDKAKKSPGPSSPNTQRSKSPSREDPSSPQKTHRKIITPGSRTADGGMRSPPISIELLRSRRPTRVAEENEVGQDSMWQVMQPACNQESSPCKRRKRHELICSPCFAKRDRKSDFQCALETTMETVRTCVREPIMSIFREASLSPEREISLRSGAEERDIGGSRNSDNFSDRHEVQEDSAREKAPFPWLSGKSEAGSRESQEKLELNALPRRDTIHRRTSLIRSVRIAMESLKRLRKSSGASSARNSEENLADAASTWDTLPDSPENLRQANEENLKNSSNTSRASISPITLRSPRRPEDPRDKLSKASSLDVSDGGISPAPDPRSGGRCRPDCRGRWSSWNHSRRNSRSPTDHGRHASQSSRSCDSTEDNEDNN